MIKGIDEDGTTGGMRTISLKEIKKGGIVLTTWINCYNIDIAISLTNLIMLYFLNLSDIEGF